MHGTFTRKAILVVDGNKTKELYIIKYSSVVSRDSVWLDFTIVVLDYLDISASEIDNDDCR